VRLAKDIWDWVTGRRHVAQQQRVVGRQAITHVIILDGTDSSLEEGRETNAGLTYKLLCEVPPEARLSLYYEAGIQWTDWRSTRDVATGRGINRQIRRAYGYLASRYRVGDRIVLMGYSRGAYAVRSLSGVLDEVGLLKAEHATVRNVREAYRHYQNGCSHDVGVAFREAFCLRDVEVEMIGVWDTVKALGLRLPLLWKITEPRHQFHNHMLSSVVRHGYQALALDETRAVFSPVLWECPPDYNGRVDQVWFRGTHGDIGGQLSGFEAARPLANIPLVWMLERLEACDVELPDNWQSEFHCDVTAPSVGTMRGWGKLFLVRSKRNVGKDRSERVHTTALPAFKEPDKGDDPDLTPYEAEKV